MLNKKTILLIVVIILCCFNGTFYGTLKNSGPTLNNSTFTGSQDADTYQALGAQTDVTVFSPSSAGVNAYNHAAQVYVHTNGDVYLMWNTQNYGEEQAGTYTRWAKSTDNGDTFSAPATLFPAQSASDDDTTRDECGRFSYPGDWVYDEVNSILYAIGDIVKRDWCTDNAWTFEGLMARTVDTSTGALGDVVYIHPVGGLSQYWTEGPWSYDSGVRSRVLEGIFEKDDARPYLFGAEVNDLFTDVRVDCQTSDDCLGRMQVKLSDGTYFRLYRREGDNRFWQQRSWDGNNWTSLTQTDIPNAPTTGDMFRFSDGSCAITSNDDDNSGLERDPLYFCQSENCLDYDTSNCYKVRDGLTAGPTYTGQSKHGGASYSDMSELSTGEVIVCYSIYKEDIACTHFTKPAFN